MFSFSELFEDSDLELIERMTQADFGEYSINLFRLFRHEMARLGLSDSVSCMPLGDRVAVVHKVPEFRDQTRVRLVEKEDIEGVLEAIAALPYGSSWDDIDLIVDPPAPLKTFDSFKEDLAHISPDIWGVETYFYESKNDEEVVYIAVAADDSSAVCKCNLHDSRWRYEWEFAIPTYIHLSGFTARECFSDNKEAIQAIAGQLSDLLNIDIEDKLED